MRYFFFFMLAFITSAVAQISDYDLLKSRFSEDIRLDPSAAETFFVKEIEDWSQSLQSDGAWQDIDYSLDDNKFSPGEHPRRMDFMARAYASPGHPQYQDQKMLKSIKKAFDAWVLKDVQSYNWWHNTIGIPQRFARTMLLLEDELGKKRVESAFFILDRAKIRKTGQNRLWYSELTVIRGAFKREQREVEEGAKEIYKVLDFASVLTKGEGIQRDYSFHQHGPLIYNGGYGSKYSLDMARLVSIFAGTKYAFPKEKTELLSRYILDGQIWMTRGNKWDYSVTGREITRKGKSAEKLVQACALLKERPLPRKKEFQACYDSLTKGDFYLNGNKFFYDSDYVTHHTKNFFMSARMYSFRTVNNDAPSNSEGLLSHHLADGATFIMRDGKEYEDIFPVWDWRHIPGTTTELKPLKPAVYEPGNWDGFAHLRYLGGSAFAGGASDGKSGIASFDFKSNKFFEKVDAFKTWAFDKDLAVALGSNISCFTHCEEIVTTIDQKNARGPVYVLYQDGTLVGHVDKKTYKDVAAVYHDGLGYFFPEPISLTIDLGKKTGNWKRINGQYSSKRVTKKTFTLYISHKNNDNYIYAITPTKNVSELKALSNFSYLKEKDIHALKLGEKVMISARKRGEICFEGHDFKFYQPTTLILNLENGELRLSDPTHLRPLVQVKLDDRPYFERQIEKGRPVLFQTGL